MAKWYLFWILTIQDPNDQISVLPRMDMITESRIECIFELTAKIEELELMLGGEWYSTHYFGGRVKLDGTLIGILAGCDHGE